MCVYNMATVQPPMPVQLPRDEDIDNELLIDEVQQRAPLYNKALKEYSDVNVKKRLWQEVCEQLFPTWERLSEMHKIKTGMLSQYYYFISDT